MEDIKVLKKMPLFHNLDNMEIVEVAKYIHTRKIEKGEYIIQQGTRGGAFYILKTGSAIVYLKKDEDHKKILGRFQPGDSFGEVSLIDRGTRSAAVEAEIETEVLFIDRESFETLISKEDSLAMKIMHNILNDLCDKLRRTNHFLLLSE